MTEPYIAGVDEWISLLDGHTISTTPPVFTFGLYWLGTSLSKQAPNMDDCRDSMLAVGWPDDSTVRFDASTGRTLIGPGGGTPLTLDAIAASQAAGFSPSTQVMELGPNDTSDDDATWTTKINTVLDAILDVAGTYTVYWPGITFRPDINDSRSTRFYSVLQTIAADRSDLTLIPVDFNSLMHNGRDETGLWNTGDSTGRHMTVPGYAVRNSILATAIGGPS